MSMAREITILLFAVFVLASGSPPQWQIDESGHVLVHVPPLNARHAALAVKDDAPKEEERGDKVGWAEQVIASIGSWADRWQAKREKSREHNAMTDSMRSRLHTPQHFVNHLMPTGMRGDDPERTFAPIKPTTKKPTVAFGTSGPTESSEEEKQLLTPISSLYQVQEDAPDSPPASEEAQQRFQPPSFFSVAKNRQPTVTRVITVTITDRIVDLPTRRPTVTHTLVITEGFDQLIEGHLTSPQASPSFAAPVDSRPPLTPKAPIVPTRAIEPIVEAPPQPQLLPPAEAPQPLAAQADLAAMNLGAPAEYEQFNAAPPANLEPPSDAVMSVLDLDPVRSGADNRPIMSDNPMDLYPTMDMGPPDMMSQHDSYQSAPSSGGSLVPPEAGGMPNDPFGLNLGPLPSSNDPADFGPPMTNNDPADFGPPLSEVPYELGAPPSSPPLHSESVGASFDLEMPSYDAPSGGNQQHGGMLGAPGEYDIMNGMLAPPF